MAAPLPDPAWGQAQAACLGCSYPLEGMGDSGVCPECGTPFFAPGDSLVLCGVARRQETVSWRRYAWGAILVGAFVYFQGIIFLIMRAPVVAGILFLAIVASVVGMLVTGSGKQRGIERFTFTPGGWSRRDLRDGQRPEYSAWPEGVAVDIRRVSSVWHRLRLTARDGSRRGRRLLDAGVRCPEGDRDWVAHALERMVRGQQARDEQSPGPTG